MRYLFPDMTDDDFINNPIKKLESLGYYYLQDWTMDEPRVPERIKLPSGRVLTLNDIYKGLDKLVMGDQEQIESLRALEYYDLIMDLDSECRFQYPSFLDSEVLD